MTYFHLRKRDPAHEPETLDDETGEEETSGDEPDDAPAGFAGALWAGASGPGQWLTARGRPGAAWTLYVGSVWSAGFYGGWVAVWLGAAWLLAVLAFIPREYKERVATRIEGWKETRAAELDEAAVGAAADPRTVLVGWLDELTRGRSGIHLDELHDALTAHPQLAHLKRAEMRAWLDRHHITVDRTLRVGKVAGRSGVSRATVQALLDGLPPLPESVSVEPAVHAPDLHDSSVESGAERGGERAV